MRDGVILLLRAYGCCIHDNRVDVDLAINSPFEFKHEFPDFRMSLALGFKF